MGGKPTIDFIKQPNCIIRLIEVTFKAVML